MPVSKSADILIKHFASNSAEPDEIVIYADGETEILSAMTFSSPYSMKSLFWLRRDNLWALKCSIDPLYSGSQVATEIRTQLLTVFSSYTITIQSVSGGSGSGVSDHGDLTGLDGDDHTQYHNDSRGDARYILSSAKGQNGGVAELDSSGKVPQGQIPLIAVSNVFSVSNQSAQLALTTQEGDVVIRTDLNKSYIRNNGSAGTMSDFSELLTPTDTVLSVNGEIGAVSLTSDNIAEGSINKYLSSIQKTDLTDSGDSSLHYHSSDRNRANHTGTQIASTISDFSTTVTGILNGISLTTNEGISGGGALGSGLNIALDLVELGTVSPTVNDYIPLIDVSESNAQKRALISQILSLVGTTKFTTGSYTGNGASNRSITGLGFQPRALIIYWRYSGGGYTPVLKTDVDGLYTFITAQWTSQMWYELDHVISLDADGFTVGDSTGSSAGGMIVNNNGFVHSFMAWG